MDMVKPWGTTSVQHYTQRVSEYDAFSWKEMQRLLKPLSILEFRAGDSLLGASQIDLKTTKSSACKSDHGSAYMDSLSRVKARFIGYRPSGVYRMLFVHYGRVTLPSGTGPFAGPIGGTQTGYHDGGKFLLNTRHFNVYS